MIKSVELYMILVFYLIISSNFLAQLFSCQLQYLLHHSMWLKHFLGFMTLLFFVVLASNGETNKATNVIVDAFILYIIFVWSTRMSLDYFIVFILLLSILYILNLYHNRDNKYVYVAKKVIEITALILLIVGSLFYYFEKKQEYKKKFSLLKFILGKPQCKSSFKNFVSTKK